MLTRLFIKSLVVVALVFSIGVDTTKNQNAHATGIPVFDAADAVADALAYLEWLFQHAQMLQDYAQEVKDWEQMLLEWEYTLEDIRSLAERFGSGLVNDALERHTQLWGDSALSYIVGQLDPNAAEFVDATIELMLAEMGVGIAGRDRRQVLLATVQDEIRKNQVEADLTAVEEKDLAFRDNLLGASSSELRNDARYFVLSDLKNSLNALGPNSEIATSQLAVTTNLFLAEQNQEVIELLARMYAEAGRKGIYENAEVAKSIQRSLEIDLKQLEEKNNSGSFTPINTSPNQ